MLVVLAVLGAGFVVVMALGRFSRSDRSGGPANDDGVMARHWKRGEVPLARGLVEPAQNLPPVLLPDDPAPADVDRLRFSAGMRGYRMDQVDEVLDILRDALAAKDRQLAEFQSGSADQPGSADPAPQPDSADQSGSADRPDSAP
ncbi:DivIVA domain-containing protein [Arthrobacter castelli]|uniref:DivIVA domain-containing protein n=1 Tax=Arthrobacter castelli TaxID=271431 RepID=UPI000422124D